MSREKIKSFTELNSIIKRLKADGKKIVTTNGVFDILHIGHVRYLQEAKKLGDILIVFLNSDTSTKKLKGPKRPLNNENERAECLAALECVDYVVIFSGENPITILNEIKPHTHVKGGDYTINQIIEKEIIEKNGGKVILINKVESRSTTELLKKIVDIYGDKERVKSL